MKKWLFRLGGVLLLLIVTMGVWMYSNLRDRHPGYAVDLQISAASEPGPIRAGFAAMPITPDITDSWTDANGDAKFIEKDGDTYEDKNGNGKFDGYWIAGFGNKRAANGVHDDVWARAVVFDDGRTRIALVSLDAIGFGHDDVVDVRALIPADAGIDYAVIASTHTHESVDLIGIWGASPLKSGVNAAYMAYVKAQTAKAIVRAAANLRPAQLRFAQDIEGAAALVNDTRKPLVKDAGLRLIHAVDAEADTTLGVLVAWADHPETLWSKNLLISSDFPHYVRESLEKGVYAGGRLRAPGLGGVAVYFNGAIGGLMTTDDDFAVRDPFADTVYVQPSFDKCRALGQRVALAALQALAHPDTALTRAGITLRAKTIELPLANPIFRLAAAIGVLDRGMASWMKMRSEVAAFTLGPASFLTTPGEIYPEIVNGGIETPVGQDFATKPVEVPPLRALMPGRYKFVFGLANDEVGYIIPRSEWDEKKPYLYGANSSPYGEVNSIGPETAPIVHRELKQLLAELQ